MLISMNVPQAAIKLYFRGQGTCIFIFFIHSTYASSESPAFSWTISLTHCSWSLLVRLYLVNHSQCHLYWRYHRDFCILIELEVYFLYPMGIFSLMKLYIKCRQKSSEAILYNEIDLALSISSTIHLSFQPFVFVF